MEKTCCKSCEFSTHLNFCKNNVDFEMINKNKNEIWFKKGELIYKRGIFIDKIYYIKSGFVKLHTDCKRHNRIVYIYQKENYIGLFGFLDNNSDIFPFSATAITNTEVCVIDASIFRNILFKNSETSIDFLKSILRRSSYIIQKISDIDSNSAFYKIASSILLYKNLYETIDEPLNKLDVIQYSNVKDETAKKIFIQLVKDNIIIITEKNYFKIIDMKKLQKIIKTA